MSIPKLLIAGQSSGVGKTTITLGLIAALHRRGLTVQSFKCGPDYIDPTYHALASGRPCRNLDTWMLTPEQMAADFQRASQDADIAIIEGVMGLFDGSSYSANDGSSAHIAQVLNIPILLILDIGKMARSAGALALGYQLFAQQMQPTPLQIGGVILNRGGSQGHADGCAEAILEATGMCSVGWLSKHSNLHIPERHLGLIPTDEREALGELIDNAANAVEATFDLDEITRIAESQDSLRSKPKAADEPQPEIENSVSSEKNGMYQPAILKKHAPVVAVARDEAFSFYYPANLELLEEAGAQIAYFSPLHDESLPSNANGLYLGGGFPEVYAGRLSQNRAIWDAVREFHAQGRPIYAECGGFMVLTEAIVDTDDESHLFCNIVPGKTHMQKRLASLGYRVAEALTDNVLMVQGDTVRGHEFHYSQWQVDPTRVAESAAWRMRRRQADAEWRPAGYVENNLLASYLHVHFGQNRELAQRFVQIMGA